MFRVIRDVQKAVCIMLHNFVQTRKSRFKILRLISKFKVSRARKKRKFEILSL